ncbi:hypothetical protein M8J75_012443 [Diaphorina citri]|nr:hypothetical protein M8J75_012443 [Diaphorina citri]
MRRLWVPLLLLHCAIFTSSTSSNDQETHIRVKRGSSEKRVVCYYTNWSVYRPGTAKFTPQNINPYLCTHLIYAFGGLDKENGLRPFDKYQDIEQGGYAKFTGLKTYNKNLKTMLAIGGWNEGSTRFSPLVADEDRRKEFVKNVLKFLRVNHFDGLDLDWEYPAFRDGGKSADRENYAQLVQELREEFERESEKTGRPRLLLTMAVPAGLEYIDKGYDVKKLNKYLDFMNILSYDYHSAFEPAVNHHSPLFPLEEDGEYNFEAQLSIDHTIKHYLKSGADPDKLVLGIPTYGRSYTLFNPESNQIGAPADGPESCAFQKIFRIKIPATHLICSSLKSDDWSVEHPNPRAMGPYAFKGNQWVGYDDQEIAKDKAKYVNDQKLGGIMFWSIDNDDFRGTCHGRPYPIIEAAKEALFGIDSELPSSTKSPSSKDSKVSTSTKRTRPKSTPSKSSVSKTTSTTTPESLTTPEPPTTPDPGSDFKCKDEGFFPHPRDCKKYFWCLDSGPSNLGIVAHQFTCPSGLYFNKGADSCDFARNVLCKIKTASTPAPSKAPITLATAKTTFNRKEPSTTSTTTSTTTTTTEAPIEEEEEVEEALSEDPQTIKQLIDLIKKLGGIEELEKQLTKEGKAPISRSLYDRVLANAGTRHSSGRQQNGPGPQNQGIKFSEDETASSSKERPKYKTIQRERPSTTPAPEEEPEDQEDTVPTTVTPKYQSIFRRRQSTTASPQEETDPYEEKPATPKYVTLSRNRGSSGTAAPVKEEAEEEPEVTQKYVTLRRPKPKVIDTSSAEDKQSLSEEEEPVVDSDEELDALPPKIITTTTTRPREKVSVFIVTPATDPVASVYRTSTWTSVVTSIMEDAITHKTKIKVNHTDDERHSEEGRAMDGIFTKNTPAPLDSRDSKVSLSTKALDEAILTTLGSSSLESSSETESTSSSTLSPVSSTLRLPLRKPANHSRFITFNRNRTNTQTTTTTLKPDSDGKNKYSRFKTKPKVDAEKDTSTKKYSSIHRFNKNTSPASEESVEATGSTRKYFGRLRSSTASSSSEEDTEITTLADGPVTAKYKYILRTTKPTVDSGEIEINKDKIIEDKIKEILETQEQNEDGQIYENEIDNNVTPSSAVRFTRPLTSRRSTLEGSRENIRVRSTTEGPLSSTRRSFGRSTTTTVAPVEGEKRNATRVVIRSRGRAKYKSNKIYTSTINRQKLVDSNEYEGEEYDSNNVTPNDKKRVIEVRIRMKARNPKQLDGTSISGENSGDSSGEQSGLTTEYSAPSTLGYGSGEEISSTENGYAETTTDFPRSDSTFITTFIPTTEQTLVKDIVETVENIVQNSQENSVENTDVIDDINKLFGSTESSDKTTTDDYEAKSTFFTQTDIPRVSSIYTTIRNLVSRGTQQYESYTSSPSEGVNSSNRVVNNPENSQRRPVIKTYVNTRRRTSASPDSTTEQAKANDNQDAVYFNRNRNTKKKFNKDENDLVAPLDTPLVKRISQEEIDRINARRKNSRYTTTTQASNLPQLVEDSTKPQRKANVTRNRGSIKAYKNPELIKELEYEEKANTKESNFLNGQFFLEVSTSPSRRRITLPKDTTTGFVSTPQLIRVSSRFNAPDENFVRAESIYFPLKSPNVDKSDAGEVKINRTRLAFTRRPTAVRSTTPATVSSTDAPIRTRPAQTESQTTRGVFRRRRPIGGSSSTQAPLAPSTLAQEVNSLPDITTSRSRKFEFPRRSSSTISNSLSSNSVANSLNSNSVANSVNSNTLPEPEALQSDYDSEASEELPELANMAVVAIHNLATAPPASYTPAVSPSTPSTTEKLRRTSAVYRQPVNIFSQSQETQQSTPLLRTSPQISQYLRPSQVDNSQYIRSEDSSALRPEYVPGRGTVRPEESPALRPEYVPVRGTVTPVETPHRGFLRAQAPRPKEKPFSRKLVASAGQSQYDYADDELYGIEPIEIPLSGKVRIHTDGYIECLDMGNFPHPFSCKKFISCAKMENGLNGSLLGWEYTCPKGLSFDPIGGICNWSAGLGCKE